MVNQNKFRSRHSAFIPFAIFCWLLLSALDSKSQDWVDLYDSAGIYWENDWEKCASLLSKALPLALEDIGAEDPDYAVLLNDLGLSYYYSGKKKEAEELLSQSLEIKEKIFGKNHQEYALAGVNLAGLYLQDGRFVQAETYYLEAIEFLSQNLTDFGDDYLQAVQDLGLLYENMGSYSKAELYFQMAIDQLSQQGVSDTDLASAFGSLGRVNRKDGRLEEAGKNINKALSLIDASGGGPNPEYATILNNLGNLHFSLGEYKEAEQVFLNSIEIRKKDPSQAVPYAESLNNLANLYQILGNSTAAQTYYLEAYQTYRTTLGDQNPQLATVMNNLGNFYENQSMYKEALEMYQNAAQIYLNFYGEDHPLYANTLNNLGSLYRSNQQFEQAEKAYLTSLDIYETTVGSQHPSYASALSNLGLLHTYLGEIEKAKPLLVNSIEIQERSLGPNHPTLTGAYSNLAIAHFIENDLVSAEPFFRKAIKNQLLQIKSGFSALSENEKEEFYNTFQDDIERFNTFALAAMDQNPQILGEMYDLQLATKAVLYRSSAGMRDNILASNDPSLIIDFEEWLDLREKLGFYYQMELSELTELGIAVGDLEKQANDLEKVISAKSHLFAQENTEYSWTDIRDKLMPGEAAIEIIRFRKFEIQSKTSTEKPYLDYGFKNNIYYAALIITSKTTDQPRIALMKHGNALENRYLSYYKNCIRFQLDDYFSYSMYWNEIRKSLEGVNKIYLSPDGIYNLMNLSAVYNPDNHNFLFDEMEILYLTSTKDLLDQEEEQTTNPTAVFFANPDYELGSPQTSTSGAKNDQDIPTYIQRLADLPGTVEEVKEIDKMTSQQNWDNTLYIGKDALESSLKKVSNPWVLHIASHGFFSPEQVSPSDKSGVKAHNYLLQSGLMLAGAKGSLVEREQGIQSASSADDGIFTAYDAMNLRLEHTELVVLSACETGLGYVKNGEGIYGLQRAFKVAGAESIIISLWPVDDSATKELIISFYEEWLKSGDKVQAFHTAQDNLRERYSQPYYWGAFIIVGI